MTWERDTRTFVELYPSLENGCGAGACTIIPNDGCLCSVALSEAAAFSSIPSRDDVLSQLKVGAFDPSTFSDSDATYSSQGSSGDVEAFALAGSGLSSTSTIFKTTDEYGNIAFFKNLVSTITLGNTYTLRNPPMFINLVKPELRDAEYEGMTNAS